jgi:pyrroloquinoline quinone (PQQ) biosynthesis protein C
VFVREALESELARASMADSDFVQCLSNGRYSKASLALYGRGLARLVENFPRRLAALASITPHRKARLLIVSNLLEEEGVIRFDSTGELFDDERMSHTSLIGRFVDAAGASETASEPIEPQEEDWFDAAIRSGRFLAASAYLNVGVEGAAPTTFSAIIPALQEHYGFTSKEIAFFVEHAAADERHRDRAIEMLEMLSDGPEQKAEVKDGVRRGVAAWRYFHRNAHRAMIR